MQNAARASQAVYQEVGTVVGVGESVEVRTGSGTFGALRAASCLLAPAQGDRVLLAVPPEGPLYVLAVLERDESAPAELLLGPDARLRAGRRVVIEAPEDVALHTAGTLRTSSRALCVSADEGTVAVKKVSWMSNLLELYVDVARSLVQKVEAHVESVTLHAKQSHRFVEELDATRAGTIDARAEKAVHLRGENTFVTAEELVKVDGELIHFG